MIQFSKGRAIAYYNYDPPNFVIHHLKTRYFYPNFKWVRQNMAICLDFRFKLNQPLNHSESTLARIPALDCKETIYKRTDPKCKEEPGVVLTYTSV